MKLVFKHRWMIYISSLILLILSLGLIGYSKAGFELLEASYASVKLLSFIFTSVENSNNYILTAKILSFLFVFSAGIKIVFYFIEENILQPIRLYFKRDHIIIFGFNGHAEELIKDINKQASSTSIILVVDEKINLLDLDIKAEVVVNSLHLNNSFLSRLKLENAKHVLCMSMNDTVDIQNAKRVVTYLENKENNILLHIHIFSYILADLFNSESESSKHKKNSCDIRVFNRYDNAARILFKEHAIESSLDGNQAHWLLEGELYLQLAFMRYIAQISYYLDERLPIITLVCKDAKSAQRELQKLYPKIDKTATINIIDSINSELETRVTNIAVLYEDDVKGLEEAIILNNCMKSTTIYLQQNETSTVENEKIIPFGSFRSLNTSDIVLNEKLDEIAKNIHNYYKNLYGGVDWKDLSLFKKNSNRMQAEHIPIKLRGINWDKESFEGYDEFLDENSDIVDKWARIEHLRWNAFHYVNGWDYAKDRDDSKKLHNCLRPFEQLTEKEQQKDEPALKMIPTFQN